MIELNAELNISEDLNAELSEDDRELDADLGELTIVGVSSWNGQTGDVVYIPPTVPTPLIGSADDITPTMVLNAIQGGRDVLITFTDEDYGVNKINYFQYIDQLNAVASCIAYENQSVQFIGTLDDNVWNIQPVRLAFNSDIPTKTSQLQNDSGYLTSAVTSFNGNTGAVTYSAPVSSVNGQTGAVSLSIPSKVSQLTNDSGYLTTAVTSFNGSSGAITYSAPVSSVNGQTGAVSLSIPSKTSDLNNDSGFITDAGVTSFNGSTGAVTYTAPVTSVNGSTGAVSGLQTTSNLVTSVSSASTDLQYASAKCLYDLLGDVESLLANI